MEIRGGRSPRRRSEREQDAALELEARRRLDEHHLFRGAPRRSRSKSRKASWCSPAGCPHFI